MGHLYHGYGNLEWMWFGMDLIWFNKPKQLDILEMFETHVAVEGQLAASIPTFPLASRFIKSILSLQIYSDSLLIWRCLVFFQLFHMISPKWCSQWYLFHIFSHVFHGFPWTGSGTSWKAKKGRKRLSDTMANFLKSSIPQIPHGPWAMGRDGNRGYNQMQSPDIKHQTSGLISWIYQWYFDLGHGQTWPLPWPWPWPK